MSRAYSPDDISCSNLSEIGDIEVRLTIARLIGCYVALEAANDPRKAGERVGSAGKPGSKPPGHEACVGRLTHARRLIATCAKEVRMTLANATSTVVAREATETPVERVGGYTVDVEGTGADRKLVARRNARGDDGKFKPGAQMTHLAAKLQQAVEGEAS